MLMYHCKDSNLLNWIKTQSVELRTRYIISVKLLHIRRAVMAVIVWFTTTYAVSAYHHWTEFESRSGWGVQHYVIKFLWPATGRWFSHGSPVSSTNKTDRHNITEILLKVALSTNKQTKHKNAHNWLYFSVEHSSLWTFVNSSFSCTQKAAGLQLRFITIRLTYRYLVKSLAGKTDEFFWYFVLIYFFWKVNILYLWSKMFILELNYCFVVYIFIPLRSYYIQNCRM